MAKRNKFRTYERKADQPIALTEVEYSGLQRAFDFFNVALFDRSVPDCFFTYQRKKNSAGSFAPDEFSGRASDLIRDGIRLNPDTFIGQTDEQIVQSLVFLMCQAWQRHNGTPSGRGYVNRELADKLKAIGLQPTSSGGVGGKETGARIFHYVIPDGAFAHAYKKLASNGWHMNLQSAPREGPKDRAKKNKSTFDCRCGEVGYKNKPSPALVCDPCATRILEAHGIDPAIIDGARMRLRADISAPAVGSYAPKPVPVTPRSYEITQPVKRKRGRPKGSKNKPQAPAPVIASYEQAKRKRGRPKGSKNKPKPVAVAAIHSESAP
jgi:hypothetical protein